MSIIGDEELSAMLEGAGDLNGHQNVAQTTLTSVMASLTSPSLGGVESQFIGSEQMRRIPFISHYSSLPQGGFSASSHEHDPGTRPQFAMSTTPGTNSGAPEQLDAAAASDVRLAQVVRVTSRATAALQQQQPAAVLWPSSLIAAADHDQKLEHRDQAKKNQIMKLAANVHVSNLQNYPCRFNPLSYAASSTSLGGGHSGSNPPPLISGTGGGLQHYHSAPSSLLQSFLSAADCHEDAFLQVSSSPLGNSTGTSNIIRDNQIDSFLADNCNPMSSITEGVVQHMESTNKLSGSTLHQYNNQFLLSPPAKSEKRASLVINSVFGGKEDHDALKPDHRLGNLQHHVGRDMNLLRQSSLPADSHTVLQDGIHDETDRSSQFPSMATPPEESLSGATSEETGAAAGASGNVSSSMYSRDDSFLVGDTISGGLLNSPTSPGHIGRKRLRGVLPGETTIDTAVKGKGSPSRGRLGEPGTLIRHTSLPATINRPTSPVFDDLDDISVPYQTRAKRGCATHPRSIAERVRRTKISERMKKLQDLVPNMDKQTNMSDMLDEAVEYIKQLQQQVQELSETAAHLRQLQVQGLLAEAGNESL